MNFKITNILNAYVFAILSVIIILGFRWILNPILGSEAALLTFIFPVILTSLLYGFNAGILATFLGLLAGTYFFLPPPFSLEIQRQEDAIRILIFILECISISALGEFYRAKEQKLEEALARISEATKKQQIADEKARNLENDLSKVWRMNTLGEMASGLAHELAQPISSIKNYTSAVQKILENETNPANSFVNESIKGIGSEADRASKFIHSLRSFIGSRKPQKQIEDINKMITEVDLLIKSELTVKNIKIRYKFSEPTLEIKIDKIQIMQVILNLLRNSIESMPTDQPKPKEILVETYRDGNGALIIVNDTGCGIPEKDSDKVYEAFFSTKESGMGMGLAISRSMIEVHNGKIWNTPNTHSGTTFKVWLPSKESHV